MCGNHPLLVHLLTDNLFLSNGTDHHQGQLLISHNKHLKNRHINPEINHSAIWSVLLALANIINIDREKVYYSYLNHHGKLEMFTCTTVVL